ncbi:response regulator [Roseicella aquatilis]|uniref:histidine kinase n=1 Tax=Roseicella aquatilis TaxID=2527868 RepID=A0A4R4DJ41_9PROT|nr:response regulator [Roseicella aquatilis]TCZ59693.1 response regulator [Roseicella aquatilis]
MPEGAGRVALEPSAGVRQRGLPGQPALVGALIAAAAAGVFAADLLTPLGIAVWVFYLVPVLLTFLLRQSLTPIGTASLCTMLMAAGFALSPPGVDPMMGAVNRGLGVTTLWAMAAASFLFIRGKLAVERQEWLQSGQVALAGRMAGEQDIAGLADGILRELAGRLGAQVGILFVRNGDGLRRRAMLAVPHGTTMPEVVREGEGLLGQAVRERRAALLPGLPEGYLRFGSVLGAAPPRTLLVAPILVDGVVIGALELGFAEAADGERALALLDRVSDAVGTALRSAEFRSRLRELLEETQRQAEELQKQGDELRSANEELEEQSQALQASQARLEQQQRELEEANVALRSQARALEQASRYKSEFLANMSHELRTPLNSSLIMARLLADNREGNLTAEQVRFAQTIEASGNDLLALINDILDLSKIEAGHAEIRPERVELAGLLARLHRTFDPIAAGKGLAFRSTVAAGTPPAIETDPQRLEQILRNFVSNALKFTEAGEVAIEADALPDGRIALSVRDTGIGIAPEHQEAIFEAFRQADGTTSRKYGGTGLGLSISRELARLLGGRIELASAPGRGSTFTLLLPVVPDPAALPRPAAQATAPAAPAAGRPQRAAPPPPALADDRDVPRDGRRLILIVEDDPEFARLLADLARDQGFQCLVTATADEAVALARTHLPHAVLLDIRLPDHTGLSVLDRLKRNTRTRHIPVHIVSAHDYVEPALAQGAVGYVLKPARREELGAALERIGRRLDQRLRRVLVVEDDPVQLDAVQRLLAADGVETVGAGTGAECLRLLAAETFDCMVLDLSLPDMSGFDLLDRLGADDSRSFPPVIVYTGRALTAEEELRLRRTSRSIIVKGARSPDRLLDEVTLFLHQVVSELPGEQQRALARALSRDAAIEGRRILVVEDDVRNVFALTSILEPHGAEIVIARNGREAIEALERGEAAGRRPDLVLMDVMMPEMDGLAATRAIRAREAWRGLPILMLTAKAMPDDQERCLAAGANDYMAKPLDVEKLLSLIRVWMPRS